MAVQPQTRAEAGGAALYLYLEPFADEAERLEFSFERISALSNDAGAFPLTLRVSGIQSSASSRERLLAFGEVPPGQYNALAFEVSAASLRGEEGDVALLVPEQPTRIEIPFTVRRSAAVVLSLRFDLRGSLASGYRFVPTFSARIPDQLATGLIGLATSRRSDTLTIFDKVSGRVTAVIPTGEQPSGVALAESRNRAYVALAGEDAVEEIDLLENEIIERIELSGGDNPLELALTPDGATLLSVNNGSNTVSLIDPLSRFETGRISVGNSPRAILIDAAGRRAYVFNTLSGTISVIDIPSSSLAGTISTESEPMRGELNGSGDQLFVIHRSSPYLTVIDPTTLSTIRRVYVGGGTTSLKVDPRTDLIYLARRQSAAVEVYDPFSLLPVETIRVGGEVTYITIDDEGNSLYLVLPSANAVQVIQIVGQRTTAMIDVGEDPFWVAFMGER